MISFFYGFNFMYLKSHGTISSVKSSQMKVKAKSKEFNNNNVKSFIMTISFFSTYI